MLRHRNHVSLLTHLEIISFIFCWSHVGHIKLTYDDDPGDTASVGSADVDVVEKSVASADVGMSRNTGIAFAILATILVLTSTLAINFVWYVALFRFFFFFLLHCFFSRFYGAAIILIVGRPIGVNQQRICSAKHLKSNMRQRKPITRNINCREM